MRRKARRICPCGAKVPAYLYRRYTYWCQACVYQRQKVCRQRYEQTPNGLAAKRKYGQSARGKARNRHRERRRIRIGDDWIAVAPTIAQARQIKAHIRRRLHDFHKG